MGCGGQCVIASGAQRMLKWSAGNWDFLIKVRNKPDGNSRVSECVSGRVGELVSGWVGGWVSE